MLLFFFQAEDGIRDLTVTGVQTCALPIWPRLSRFGLTNEAVPHTSGASATAGAICDFYCFIARDGCFCIPGRCSCSSAGSPGYGWCLVPELSAACRFPRPLCYTPPPLSFSRFHLC